jgi:DNA-binding Xre family transcriptional regulator/molecular chaperone GrpE (heat shock protein)
MSIDRTPQLQTLMQQVGINNFRELYRSTGISAHTINKLRSGNLDTLRWESIVRISDTFKISTSELIRIFGDRQTESPDRFSIGEAIAKANAPLPPTIEILKQEYQQLQQQFQQQRDTLQSEFQFQSLQTLESFLTYFPTAKHAAINNPDFPASKLFPLVGLIDRLIQSWGVTAIGAVGSQVAYDPRWHQLIEGTADLDWLVTVRYVGYRQGEKLIFRAKVGC